MADDNKTIEQQNQVLDSQDSISSSSDTFPASGNEVFTSETYSTAKSGPDALAEDLGEVGQAGAVIYIQHKTLGNISSRTSRFYLTNMGIGLQEKSQILETFGTSNISFFGQKTKVYNFAGVVLDWKSQNGSGSEYWQASSLIHMYNNTLRGTALVESNQIAVIKVMNHTVFGYPLVLQVNYDQGSDKYASFSLSWVVTKHLLGVPGIVTENQLKSNYSPIQRNAISEILQNAITKITEAVEAAMIATTVPTDSSQYGAFNNDLIHKNLEQLKNIVDEGKIKTNMGDLKDKLLDLRAGGDGQVSPFIASIFGASETIIEKWFSDLETDIEIIATPTSATRTESLSRFRVKLTIIRDFSDALLSLSNSLRG